MKRKNVFQLLFKLKICIFRIEIVHLRLLWCEEFSAKAIEKISVKWRPIFMSKRSIRTFLIF